MRIVLISIALIVMIIVQSLHFMESPEAAVSVTADISVSFSLADIVTVDLDAASCCAGFDQADLDATQQCNIDCGLLFSGTELAEITALSSLHRWDNWARLNVLSNTNFRPPIG